MEREDRKLDTSSSLSRKGSITSSNTNTSRLPKHTPSLFSRVKSPKPPQEPTFPPTQLASSLPVGRGQTSVKISSSASLTASVARTEPARSAGLGISMENKTAQVNKAGKTRNVLRRKAPTIESRGGYARTESSASSYDPPPSRQALDTKSSPEGRSDPFPNQVLGITAPNISSSYTTSRSLGLGPSFEHDTSSSRMARYNSRKTPSPSPLPNPAPTPNYANDSGSSTRFSDSPSSHSHSSTPTSMTSQSPGISTPVSIPSVRSNQKPSGQSRPPVSMANKWRQGLDHSSQAMSGLTAVRESGTSSSSSSTVKASGSRDESSRAASGTGRSSPLVPAMPAVTSPVKPVFGRSPGSDRYSPGRGAEHLRANVGRSPMSPDFAVAAPSPTQVAGGETPPMRPSRDGVPSLDMRNLGITISRPGPPTIARSPSSASSISAQHPRLASSPNITSGKTPRLNERQRGQELSAMETNISGTRSKRDPSPQSATSSRSTSRFALFSRRTKSPLENTAAEASDRAAKKGPAAGTGHEGYGKYARRGRSGSLSTSASRGRSTSSNSIGRTPSSRKSSLTSRDEEQMDDFYRSRLEPKKIIGGGQSVASSVHGSEVSVDKEAHKLSSDASRSGAPVNEKPPLETRQLRSPFSSTTEPNRTHALRHVDRRIPQKGRSDEQGIETFEHEAGGNTEDSLPTLATRRSIHRSQLLAGAEPLRIPAPIDTKMTAPSPALDSLDTYQSSVPQSASTVPLSDDISEGHEGNWLKSSRQDRFAKSPKKWAFFHRGQTSPKKSSTPVTPQPDMEKGARHLRAQVSRFPESRNMAYYEMMNPAERGDDESNAPDLAEDETQNEVPARGKVDQADISLRVYDGRSQRLSVLLPSPPKLIAEFPQVPSQPRPDLSKSPEVHQENALANDNPAAQTEPRKPRLQQIGRIPRVVSKRDRTHKPPPQSFSRPRPYTPRQDVVNDAPSSAPVLPNDGQRSAFDRPILGIQTDAIPQTGQYSQDSAKPASAPVGSVENVQRGRVKEEFLAFPPRIGSEVSGSTSSGNLSVADITAVVPRPGAASTEEEEWNEYNDFLDIMESPAPLLNPKANPYEKGMKAPGWAPAPLDIRKEPHSGKQTAATYPPALPPTRKLPSPPKQTRSKSPPPALEASTSADKMLVIPQRRSLVASSRYSTSSIESEADSLADMENPLNLRVNVPSHLRLQLLTISKLLSFDRVLFSPAHAEVSGNKKSRILVLDGLGVDDWAFFCAQEYPDAQVSNLSATSRTSVSAKNYDHHHFPNLDAPFPFPQNYFSAAVLRFPVAASEDAYNNIIKEFRRVLSPSAYLEILVLDIDMVKMGNETRKALRGLKERKQLADPRISLKPQSDNIQKMLGGKAFENLKQCMLEIPVASHTGSSRVRSFNEKMELLDEMPNDEDRTRHLPEIGRWWFSRCYESGPTSRKNQPKSIWDNQSVLEECKVMETGFKMLLCYAQKPNKRRTLSL